MTRKPDRENSQYTLDDWWEAYALPTAPLSDHLSDVDLSYELMSELILDRLLSESIVSDRMRIIATRLLASLMAADRHVMSGALGVKCQAVAESIVEEILDGAAIPDSKRTVLTRSLASLIYDNYLRDSEQDRYATVIQLQNRDDAPGLTVFVEPRGREHFLEPGAHMTVAFDTTEPQEVDMAMTRHGLAIRRPDTGDVLVSIVDHQAGEEITSLW